MKMKSIARGPFKYGGAVVQPGAEFSVKSERDAKILRVMKRAEDFVAPPPVVRVKAEPKPEARTTDTKAGEYKRRDMVAEEPKAKKKSIWSAGE